MTKKQQTPDSPLIQLMDKWEGYLTEKELAKIFKAAEINVKGTVEIKSGRLINDKEFTANVQAKIRCDDGTIENSNTLISFRLGPPTYEQFIRVTYRSGANIGIRIIIHEGDGYERDFPNDPAGDVYEIGKLVNINNTGGLKTYLIEAKGLSKQILENKNRKITYVYEDGPGVNDNPLDQLPTMRQIQEAEFWNCYYLTVWNEYYPGVLFGKDDEWVKVYRDLSLPLAWTDEGLSINIFGDYKSEMVKLIWDNKLSELQAACEGSRIELNEESGKPYGISIRILDLPMKNLIKMGPRKKAFYGQYAHDVEHNFLHLVDVIITDLKIAGKLPK